MRSLKSKSVIAVFLLGVTAACNTTSNQYCNPNRQAALYYGGDGSAVGTSVSYDVEMHHIPAGKAIEIMKGMACDFPGYRSHELLSSTPELRTYTYRTHTPKWKLEEWITRLVENVGLKSEEDVFVIMQEDDIILDGDLRKSKRKYRSKKGRFH